MEDEWNEKSSFSLKYLSDKSLYVHFFSGNKCLWSYHQYLSVCHRCLNKFNHSIIFFKFYKINQKCTETGTFTERGLGGSIGGVGVGVGIGIVTPTPHSISIWE